MIVINVFLKIKPDAKENYLKFVNNLVLESKKELGCLFYGHFQEVLDDTKYVIVENWKDQMAVDLHNETVHLKNFIQNVNQFLSDDFEIVVSAK